MFEEPEFESCRECTTNEEAYEKTRQPNFRTRNIDIVQQKISGTFWPIRRIPLKSAERRKASD